MTDLHFPPTINSTPGEYESGHKFDTPHFPQVRCVVIITNSLMIIMGNIVTLTVLPKLKNVHESTRVFLMALAVSDLATGLLTLTFGAPSSLFSEWYFGRVMCVIVGLLVTFLPGFSMVCVLLMSFDRYISITKPLRYPVLATRNKAILAIIACVSTNPISTYFLGTVDTPFDNVTFSPTRGQCLVDFGNPDAMIVSTCMLSIIIVSILIVAVIYLRILCIAWTAARNLAMVHPDQGHQSRTFSRSEWKATRTTLIVAGAFSIAWLPYTLSHIWENTTGKRLAAPVEFAVFILPAFNCWWNVVIYSLMNRQFRQKAKQMLGFHLDAMDIRSTEAGSGFG